MRERSYRQKTARQGAVEDYMVRVTEDLKGELGAKMALLLTTYHLEQVQPRLEWLETPWYKKLWLRATWAAKWLKSVLTRSRDEGESEDTEPDTEPEPEA